MKRVLFLLVAVAISGGMLIGQSQRATKSRPDTPAKVQSEPQYSSSELSQSDYRAELRNERREARQQRRRCSRDNNLATALATLGADVDNMVGNLNHIEIMLDDDGCITTLDQLRDNVQQLTYILEV